MVRRIIEIDQEKCNGCGACAAACHEGAIGMVDGKAVLLRDDYCDIVWETACPPAPTGAIIVCGAEAAAYDEAASWQRRRRPWKGTALRQAPPSGGCPAGGPGPRPAVASPFPRRRRRGVPPGLSGRCRSLVPVEAPV